MLVPQDFEQWLSCHVSALTLSEDRVIAEGRHTASKFEQCLTALQERFTTLSEENSFETEQRNGISVTYDFFKQMGPIGKSIAWRLAQFLADKRGGRPEDYYRSLKIFVS